MKKKLLIFGVSGLTGYKIAQQAIKDFDVYGIFNTRQITVPDCTISKMDITDKNQLDDLFSQITPDIVINTTALHNVDFCEDNKEKSFDVNCNAVRCLFENSQKHNSRLIHISTDYVFEGNNKKPYKEEDSPSPLSIYGLSKLEGENILSDSHHIVIRPSVVYGWTPMELAGTVSSSGKPMNFAMWLLSKLRNRDKLKIVTDQFATATIADSLAESCLRIAESEKGGLYHVSGLSCESRYEFAIKFAKEFGYSPDQIQPTTSAEFKQKAKRPSYSCLDCTKAIKDFNLNLLTTEKALEVMKGQVEKEAPELLS